MQGGGLRYSPDRDLRHLRHQLRAAAGLEEGWACEYLAPARFGDELDVHLRVLRKGPKSPTYGFEITRAGEPVARGRTTCACCELDGPRGLRSVPIPAWIAERIEEAGAAADFKAVRTEV